MAEEGRVGEAVVEDYVSYLEAVTAGDREEAGVARPGTDEGYEAGHEPTSTPMADARRSASSVPRRSASTTEPKRVSRAIAPWSSARRPCRRSMRPST